MNESVVGDRRNQDYEEIPFLSLLYTKQVKTSKMLCIRIHTYGTMMYGFKNDAVIKHTEKQ